MQSQRSTTARACQQCGSDFFPWLSHGDRQKFCSRACLYEAAKRPLEDRVCPQCGNPFKPPWLNSPQRFCSYACTHTHKPLTLTQEFWSHVKKADGCWLWTGSRTVQGYGRFKRHKRLIRAHRFALSLALGRPLDRQEFACHKCNNPPCVRVGPGHIYLGTPTTNMQDAVEAGVTFWQQPEAHKRHKTPKGEDHPRARLTEDLVRTVRRLRKEGWAQQAIADHVGTRQGTIAQILGGYIWGHVL